MPAAVELASRRRGDTGRQCQRRLRRLEPDDGDDRHDDEDDQRKQAQEDPPPPVPSPRRLRPELLTGAQ
ncbi:MAG TPA: hypothetical protein VHO07_06245 [Streptosporangiaceae bacterium]|nr:hypothetical protein [Streptosporangiaceae bacterium]